jgi:hypothetical protein
MCGLWNSQCCLQKSGSAQLGVLKRGRFHLKPRHCPLALSPARRTPKTPLLQQKRVFVGRTEALRLCLRRCFTPASKNQVQPSSGRRQGGDLTSNLATALWLSLLPATHPRPRYSTKMSRHRLHGIATAPSSSVTNRNLFLSSSGCRKESD